MKNDKTYLEGKVVRLANGKLYFILNSKLLYWFDDYQALNLSDFDSELRHVKLELDVVEIYKTEARAIYDIMLPQNMKLLKERNRRFELTQAELTYLSALSSSYDTLIKTSGRNVIVLCGRTRTSLTMPPNIELKSLKSAERISLAEYRER